MYESKAKPASQSGMDKINGLNMVMKGDRESERWRDGWIQEKGREEEEERPSWGCVSSVSYIRCLARRSHSIPPLRFFVFTATRKSNLTLINMIVSLRGPDCLSLNSFPKYLSLSQGLQTVPFTVRNLR